MLKITCIGHLGKDAVVNQVNGKSVINFNIASSEKWKDAEGNQKEKTTWINAQYWTDRTAIAPYLKKGTQVYIEGTPSIREWETQDGKRGVSLECRVGMVQLLGSKQEGQEGATAAPAAAKPQQSEPSYQDESPF
jgi:single-strand DNA-binding protein